MPIPIPIPRPPTTVGRLLSCREAGKILDVSSDTIRRLAYAGQLEAVRVGQRTLRVSEASVLSLTATAKAEGGDK